MSGQIELMGERDRLPLPFAPHRSLEDVDITAVAIDRSDVPAGPTKAAATPFRLCITAFVAKRVAVAAFHMSTRPMSRPAGALHRVRCMVTGLASSPSQSSSDVQ